jgi:hypothetical protein
MADNNRRAGRKTALIFVNRGTVGMDGQINHRGEIEIQIFLLQWSIRPVITMVIIITAGQQTGRRRCAQLSGAFQVS